MNKIKQLREAANMSQRELAARLRVSQVAVVNWERGIANPSWERAPELARVLGCSIDDLFSDAGGVLVSHNPAPVIHDTRVED